MYTHENKMVNERLNAEASSSDTGNSAFLTRRVILKAGVLGIAGAGMGCIDGTFERGSGLLETQEGREYITRLQITLDNMRKCSFGGGGTILNLLNSCSWKAFDVHPSLVWSLHAHESLGRCDVRSVAGAKGPGQFVRSTWHTLGEAFAKLISNDRSLLDHFPMQDREALLKANREEIEAYLKNDSTSSNLAVNVLYSSLHLKADLERAKARIPNPDANVLIAWKWAVLSYHIGWKNARPLLHGELTPEEVFRLPNLDLESYFSFVHGGFGAVKQHYKNVMRGWPYADEYFHDQSAPFLDKSLTTQPLSVEVSRHILKTVPERV